MAALGEVALMVYNFTMNCSYNDLFMLNNTNGTYPEPPDNFINFFTPPAWLIQFAKISYGLVAIFGLGGNSLVIYVVLRYYKTQRVTNMYILNLAVADEMYLIGLPFLLTTMTFHSWPFGRVMCKIYMASTSINQFTSSLLLTVMSADRYIAVCHPIQSPRYRRPFIAKFSCLTAWTLSALLMVPIYMYANTLDVGEYINCNIYWPESSYMNGEMAFTLYAFTLGFALPFLLILLFYFLVICKLRNVGPKNKSKEKKRTHRKVTYLVLSVVTVYILCWLPYWCAQMWLTFLPPETGQNTLTFTMMLLTHCLSYANSAVNPILYAFLSDNFKKSFAQAFPCASKRDVNAVENSVFPKTKSGYSRQTDKKSASSKTMKPSHRKRELELSTAVALMKSENDESARNGINRQLETVAVIEV
ncbi:Somatostatin receptor type 1 like protein [Argiope bruennichi]|uniref:Somatostatin receptor type 1 like protein n=1 Tax=Argiope bruennichi TaxID=94029 RepID=A0A8T0G2K9_ARGBR|nr:Somatostatin receptor type 1 like protein [Argiope bruennichi]